jgi:5'-deoxynucleotidase YfbR-like HD superfamily hydrolase
MMIADDVDANNPDIVVNTEKVLRKSLLHDTEEAITSDVPYNVKHRTEEFHKVISAVLSDISEESYQGCSDIFKAYHLICRDAKEDVEGRIVDLADMIELALYCMEEVATGNMYMQGLLEKAIIISSERNKEFCSLFVNDLLFFIKNASSSQLATLNCL